MKEKVLKSNKTKIMNNKKCVEIIAKINQTSSFLNNLSNSFFGRTFIFAGKTIDCSKLIDSANYTLRNTIECSKRYCLSDAMTLLRKFKDDLWFILYALTFKEKNNELGSENAIIKKMNKWFNNTLRWLTAEEVIRDVFSINELDKLDEKFNVKNSLKDMAQQMDNYVHSNGLYYYNNLIFNIDEKIISNLNLIKKIAVNNVVFFLIILAVRFPYCLSSSDYEVFSDIGITPPCGCQYWLAPYIDDFLKTNKEVVDENIKYFLVNNSCMDFSSIK